MTGQGQERAQAHAAFIRENTEVVSPPLVPELRIHMATEVTPLWLATEAEMARVNLPPPYWAFAWPGGQALARHVLDNPGIVRGRTVLDFAAGSGMLGIACVLAGAGRVIAAEIDPIAVSAIALNAAINDVTIEVVSTDLVGDPLDGVDLVLCGDVCYERPMADRVISWLRPLAADRTVLLGDPGRAYLPDSGLELLARHAVPTPLDLEDRTVRDTAVWRLLPNQRAG
ncbi:class I SAM-dependent methyltransferase [Arenibaculum pallidiluteum]|uniref:class I SAM-dependent methyltransferase n=1 Tax=Arenibaculum pallidiluteum TaxID=2812559 RepID=UPI001A963BF2|nr:methyltransferase [Arenibaculum pallidiluteum]